VSKPEREMHGRFAGLSSSEVSLCGAMLIDPTVLDRCDMARPEDFSDRRLGKVWTLGHRLHADGTPLDLVTLLNAWEATGEAVDVDFIHGLLEAKATAVNAEYHAAVVRTDADRRRAIQACLGAIHTLEHADVYARDDVERAMDDVVMSIDRACTLGGTGDDRADTLERATLKMLKTMDERSRLLKEGGMPRFAISSGFSALDELMGGGFLFGEVYGIGADEKVGKTALAMQIVERAAMEGHSVLLFSFEVALSQLAARIISARTGVRLSNMLSGAVTTQQTSDLIDAYHMTKPWAERVHLRCCPGESVDYVIREARRFLRSTAHRKHPLGLLVLDHIGCVARSPSLRRGASDDDHLRDVGLRVTDLTKATDIATLLLTQHNRRPQAMALDALPRPERCRGSAIIQEKVATLIQIHRPGSQEHCDVPAEEALLCATLNRMGETGRVAAHFDGPRQRFEVPRGFTRDGWATLR
jgi:replicative DNA helicase